jgi:cbb3-type cytochrome oxidase maturation protein
MDIIILLISISLFIAVGFLGVFLWNVRSGQYDDTETPAIRMLFENTNAKNKTIKETPGANADRAV